MKILNKKNVFMSGRYITKKKFIFCFVFLIDAFLRLFFLFGRKGCVGNPKKILIMNWSHLGDVVTSIGAITELKRLYPECQMGIIVGSWALPVLSQCNEFDYTHIVDHWLLNRSSETRFVKFCKYIKTLLSTVIAVRRVKYDLSVNFYPYMPGGHQIPFLGGVKVRAGFSSCGLSPLLTHPVDWVFEDRHISDYNRELLAAVCKIKEKKHFNVQSRMDVMSRDILPAEVISIEHYIVIHPCGGSLIRDWGVDNWKETLRILSRDSVFSSYMLVITGAGKRDVSVAQLVSEGTDRCINLSGKTDWMQFTALLAHASLIICPDTVTAHAGALFETPTVCLFPGTNNPHLWGADNRNCRLITHSTSCAPCYSRGCDTMECIKKISPCEVVGMAKRSLWL